MGRRAQTHQGPPGGDPRPECGPGPHPRHQQETQGRPSLNIGTAFARTVRHFFPDFNSWLGQVPDPRRQDRVEYRAPFLLWAALLLFVGKLGSRRQLDFKYRDGGECVLANLNRLAETEQGRFPCNDTVDDYLRRVGQGPVAALRARAVNRLVRMRVLDSARVQGRLVACVDGTGYLVFRFKHCEHCLTRQAGQHTLYCHQALEAKVLGPAQTVFSLGTEFIDNRQAAGTPPGAGEQKRKQDCELKAARRLWEGTRREFPNLKLLQSADALSACGEGFQIARDFNLSFVTVFKEGGLPALWREFQALLGLSPQNRLEAEEGGWRHVYRWVDELPYTDSDKREWKLKAIEYEGEGPSGERSRWAFLVSSDLAVNRETVERLVWEAGRARWREENQGFNVQKNGGMNLEHAYSEGEHFGAYYVLLQIAHILLQLLEKGGLLRQLARQAGKQSATGLFGSLRNIAEFFVESLRNLAWPQEAFAPGGIQIRLDSS